MTPVLSTHNLSIGYRQSRRQAKVIGSGILTALHGGELVCLLGPNGIGKSTLLRTLAGMQPVLGGRITLLGRDARRLTPAERARLLSVVLTDRVRVGMLSAYELVALGRYPYTDWRGQLTERDRAAVCWAIQAVGAGDLTNCRVEELSDGERQKIMIARALAQEPHVMLLDEPTAFLDLPYRVEVMRTLRNLTRTTGRAILLSTHDLDLALRSADRVWLMTPDGSLQTGAPEDLILSGAFQATFQREGVEFDTHTGSFTIVTDQAGVVHLSGEGIPTLWTARALEREGFSVSQNGGATPIHVEVLAQNDHVRWRSVTPGEAREHDSIHDLLATLRNRSQPTAH